MASPKRRPKTPKPSPKSRNAALFHIALAVCALITITLIAYRNSLSNSFVWDDHEQIVLNPALKPTAPVGQIFSSDIRFAHQEPTFGNRVYRPLQMLTYRMIAANFGFNSTSFHAANLLLAIGNVLAAFSVFYLLRPNIFAAFAAAALFAIYPIHTEAVDWIASSPDLGCCFFFLLAFALFLSARKTQSDAAYGRASTLYIFSVVLYSAALLWKETAIVFPLVIIGYVLLLERNGAPRLWAAFKSSTAYWIVLFAYLGLRFRVLGILAGKNRNWDLSPVQLVLTTCSLMLSYWGKLIWPFRLNAYYVFSPIRSLSDPRATGTIVLSLAAIGILVYLTRRISLAAFAALWVVLTLLPVMNIYALGRNVFAERYLYLPSVGFCLLLTVVAGALLGRLPQGVRQPVALSSLVIVLSVFTFATIQRNLDWKDDKTLFAQTLLLSPDAPFVHNMVAVSESEDPNHSGAAEDHYRQAIDLIKQQAPPDLIDMVVAYQGLASLYADRGDNQHTLEALAKAREILPNDLDADSEEALILVRTGRWSEAEPLLERVLAAQPENENALSSMALLTWQYHNDRAKAAELFLKALAAHPEPDAFNASVHNNLGSVYAEMGDLPSAIQQFKQAVAAFPQDPKYHTNLANAYGAANRYDEARAQAEAALQIVPNDPEALEVLKNLGVK